MNTAHQLGLLLTAAYTAAITAWLGHLAWRNHRQTPPPAHRRSHHD